jgi:hypothetical protein
MLEALIERQDYDLGVWRFYARLGVVVAISSVTIAIALHFLKFPSESSDRLMWQLALLLLAIGVSLTYAHLFGKVTVMRYCKALTALRLDDARLMTGGARYLSDRDL